MGNDIFLLKPNNNNRTTLNKAYNKHLNSILQTINEEEEYRWEIYSIIIEHLIKLGKSNYLKELQYRLTDGENPNEIILNIIEKESDNMDNLTWGFKKKLEEYLEEDYFRRFYC